MNIDSLSTILPHADQPLETIFWASGILLSGIIAGLLTEFIIKRLNLHWALKTKWLIDDFLIYSMRGLFLPLFFVISFYIATLVIPDLQPIVAISKKICFCIIIFLVTHLIARFLSRIIRHYCSTAEVPLPSTLISNLSSVIIFIVGILVILQTLGISITPILTTLGIGGLAVALALQDTLANLFSGLNILLSKQVHIGDYIRIDASNEGYISDISWRNTTIKTTSNNLIIIPNSKLSTLIVTNFSKPSKECTFTIDIGVAYDSDLSFVEKITIETIKNVMSSEPGGVDTFEPIIRFSSFADSSIIMTIIMRAADYPDQGYLKHVCIKKLHEKYREVNIDIPYPVQTIELKQQIASCSKNINT